LGDLEPGQWRYLTPPEIRALHALKRPAGKRSPRTAVRRRGKR
jgi:hypothetical protein